MDIKKIMESLKQVNGLDNVIILSEKDKETIKKLEENNNLGVLEAIKRKFVVACSHNSTFRPPLTKIVEEKNGKIVFPPVPFPEVKAKDVVSGSPSLKVHNFLSKRINLKKDDATLIIGFND